jgi:hypothetical protein
VRKAKVDGARRDLLRIEGFPRQRQITSNQGRGVNGDSACEPVSAFRWREQARPILGQADRRPTKGVDSSHPISLVYAQMLAHGSLDSASEGSPLIGRFEYTRS